MPEPGRYPSQAPGHLSPALGSPPFQPLGLSFPHAGLGLTGRQSRLPAQLVEFIGGGFPVEVLLKFSDLDL